MVRDYGKIWSAFSTVMCPAVEEKGILKPFI